MFEIQTERGKGEKIIDLSLDGADLCLQQSTIKGLQEIMVSDILQAESLIGRGMLKRATAMTNSNNQSSRSHCIINICSDSNTTDRGINEHTVLTIVDLAGAEREKRTGNQGVRLLESNFINNTSMVFGLCLRALLEHQKNPKKPLQKHFQNSLLTRYLRDYMEGKKRMTLILTVKQGEDDYLDTSFLLRKASPYMKIKFNNVDELSSVNCQKRHIHALPRIDECKRRKFNELDACMINGRNAREDLIHAKEMVPKQHHEQEHQEVSISTPGPVKLEYNGSVAFEAKRSRDIQIMQDFSKALWNVLKDYKKKLEVSENIVQSLKENLIKKNTQYLELKKELKDLRNRCSCSKDVLAESSSLAEVFADTESGAIFSPQVEQCGANNVNQATLDACSPKLKGSECSNNLGTYDANGTQHQEIYLHKRESFPSKESRIEDLCELKYAAAEDGISNADGTGLGHAESVFSSSQSQMLLTDNSCPSMEQRKIHDELEKKMLVPSSSPTEDVHTAVVCNIKNFSAGETKINAFSRPLNLEKPKRRLLPSSSILLEKISNLDLEDEKQKGSRGERKLAAQENDRTQGSISLLRLLRRNLHP